MKFFYAGGDEYRLLGFIRSFLAEDEFTGLGLGPQFLLPTGGIVADHLPGGGEDIAGGAVVLLQFDDLGIGEVLVEFQNDAGIGAPPAIDGLVIIAHDTEVAVFLREQRDEPVLSEVDVLVFIHQEVAESVL